MTRMEFKAGELIDKSGIDMRLLAYKLDMSVVGLDKLRKGETQGIKFETIEKLCKVLRVEPNDLFVFVPTEEEEAVKS